jgi:hypothetical protein
MKLPALTAVAAALALALPAWAQSNAELLEELRALKGRVADLEKKLEAASARPPAAAAPQAGQWGMTPEQAQEFNRIAVKTEALEDSRDASGLKGLTISGYMDPVYMVNKAQDRAGFQFLNPVSDGGYHYDNSTFGAAMIDFLKETDEGIRWRLTLAPSRGIGTMMNGESPVHEATVSIPLTDLQTRLIAGQMPDWSGYELFQAPGNKLITHNLLFDFTLPLAYTGAGLDVTSGKWWLRGMVANMNASKRAAGEKTPVLAYRVDYSRGEYQGFGFAGVHGKAANFRGDDGEGNPLANPVTGDPYSLADSNVNLFEVDGYFIRGDWTLQGQLSYGQQKDAAITADPVTGALRDAEWWGASALAAYKFTPRWEGVVRADYLRNRKNGGGLLGYSVADGRNGIGPDPFGDPEVGADRTALSFGLSYLLYMNTTLKAEYRLDRASVPVFENVQDGSYSRSNQIFGASVVVAF